MNNIKYNNPFYQTLTERYHAHVLAFGFGGATIAAVAGPGNTFLNHRRATTTIMLI